LTDRITDLTDLGTLRHNLRHRMKLFAEHKWGGSLEEAYAWVGEGLGIEGILDVDALDEGQLRRAMRAIKDRGRRAVKPELSGDDLDEWLKDVGHTREEFARVTGRKPIAVVEWTEVPTWAEAVMDVLDEEPALWAIETPRNYPHPPPHLRQRAEAAGLSYRDMSRITGSRTSTIQKWLTKGDAPGWLELVLRGIESGTIPAREEKVWSNRGVDV
jgi:hypothetical protein